MQSLPKNDILLSKNYYPFLIRKQLLHTKGKPRTLNLMGNKGQLSLKPEITAAKIAGPAIQRPAPFLRPLGLERE